LDRNFWIESFGKDYSKRIICTLESLGWESLGWESLGWESLGWESLGWESLGWDLLDRISWMGSSTIRSFVL